MKKLIALVLLVTLFIGCSTKSLDGTKWESIDKAEGEIIMMKTLTFETDFNYSCVINNHVTLECDTIEGQYEVSGNKVKFLSDNEVAELRNDSLILHGGSEGYLIYKRK